MKWIDVNDYLPPANNEVIVWNGAFAYSAFYHNEKWTILEGHGIEEAHDVTHWQPYPEPPEMM